MRISFSKPPALTTGLQYILESLNSGKICGDHKFSGLCHHWLEEQTQVKKAMLTTSGTHSLELAAILLDLKAGDEVIMPSFTFPSTANAFLLRGCKIRYVDIEPNTMNIDPLCIEEAITEKTKVIVPVHYAGVSCNMKQILKIASENAIFVVEDAAQAILSYFENEPLGSLGDFGCLSFHETKNITCGEGGALLINNSDFVERAEIVREKGTNRASFFRGEINKYSWQDLGSSYLLSDLNAALLYSQFQIAHDIMKSRVNVWQSYKYGLAKLEAEGHIEIQVVPEYAEKFNAHIFFFKAKSGKIKNDLLAFLKKEEIWATSHYVPLHSTKFGQETGLFVGKDNVTTDHSNRLIRLPIYYSMTNEEVEYVIEKVIKYYSQ